MSTQSKRPVVRATALSRDRIVAAAIALLDTKGERGLTFRALTTKLKTGPGAVYWHVTNKEELLAAATDEIIAGVMRVVGTKAAPANAIRAIALALFDAIDAHPWVGAELSRGPLQSAMLQLLERIGSQLQALEVPKRAQFSAAVTLFDYMLGVASQNAANARSAHGRDREGFPRQDRRRVGRARRRAISVHRAAGAAPTRS